MDLGSVVAQAAVPSVTLTPLPLQKSVGLGLQVTQ